MWTIYVLVSILLWGVTSIFYKKGADKTDKYIHLKYSVIIGLVFFVIASCYIMIREEPFSIWESAIHFWPCVWDKWCVDGIGIVSVCLRYFSCAYCLCALWKGKISSIA